MLPCEKILRQTTLTHTSDDAGHLFCVVLLVRTVGLGSAVEIFEGELGFDGRPCFPTAVGMANAPTTLTDPAQIFDYEVNIRERLCYEVLPVELTEPYPTDRPAPHVGFQFAGGYDGYERALTALPALLAWHPDPAETLAAFAGKNGDDCWPIAEEDPLLPVLIRLAWKGLVKIERKGEWFDADALAALAQQCPAGSRDLYVAMDLLDPPESNFADRIGVPASSLVL